MIKRYGDFLKDKINESKSLVCPHCGQEININDASFLEKFDHLISLLKDEYYSFTRIVSNNRIDIELSPFIKEAGLTWEEIEKNKLLIFDNIDKYYSINGGVDYLLYLLDKKYTLGGFDTDLKNNLDELAIKYKYGYHLNHYGEKYLLQCFDSIEDYYECILENLIYIIQEYDNGIRNTNFSYYFESLPESETHDIMKKIGEDWYLNTDKFYDVFLGHTKDAIKNKRGDDIQQKIFNILIDIINSFFEREIREEIIEVEGIDDQLIKISFT
jgi:hypothetical protein